MIALKSMSSTAESLQILNRQGMAQAVKGLAHIC